MSAATAAAQTVETQKLMSDRDRSHSFQMDKLEVSLYFYTDARNSVIYQQSKVDAKLDFA